MDETRSINGNLPPADIYRTKAASAADDGDGGGLGNAYEKAQRKAPEEEPKEEERQEPPGTVEDDGSDPLLWALDRMQAVEGYHPVDQHEVAQHQAERAYGSTTIKRKARENELPASLSKLEQHGALEERRVEELVDEEAPRVTEDVDYLPHDTGRIDRAEDRSDAPDIA